MGEGDPARLPGLDRVGVEVETAGKTSYFGLCTLILGQYEMLAKK